MAGSVLHKQLVFLNLILDKKNICYQLLDVAVLFVLVGNTHLFFIYLYIKLLIYLDSSFRNHNQHLMVFHWFFPAYKFIAG